MNKRKSTKHASRVQIVLIGDVLRRVCKQIDGVATYDDGWTDERVRDEIDITRSLPVSSVNRIRRELIGELRRGVPTNASFADLQRRVEALEAWTEQFK